MEQRESDRVNAPVTLEYRKRVCQAMDFISNNIERDLSLDEIAEAGCFSKFHFHRIFKAAVGETVAEFTRRLRLELAANRLIGGRGDVTTVAMECGFSSSQNFAKAFKAHFGMTPTQYQKSKKGNKLGKERDALGLKTAYSSGVSLNRSREINERRPPMKAQVKNMPEFYVAYVRKVGPYGQTTCEEGFAELMQWAGPKGYLQNGGAMCLYWDNPEVTPGDKCRTDVCVTVPKDASPTGAIGLQTIAGGPYFVYSIEVSPTEFRQAWEDVFVQLVEKGYECADKPCYELYHNNAEEHPQKKWVVDICVPLKG